jgi:hypothetical protein
MNWISIDESKPDYNDTCLCIADDGPDHTTFVGEYETGRCFKDHHGYSWRVKWWWKLPEELTHFQP